MVAAGGPSIGPRPIIGIIQWRHVETNRFANHLLTVASRDTSCAGKPSGLSLGF